MMNLGTSMIFETDQGLIEYRRWPGQEGLSETSPNLYDYRPVGKTDWRPVNLPLIREL